MYIFYMENIFGMIDRNNRYEGLPAMYNMTAENIVNSLDRWSMRIRNKWLRSVDYFSTDSLLYGTNRALATLGSKLNINYTHAT